MIRERTLLADVAALRGVLRAMDTWEAAGGDLVSLPGRQRFVDSLTDDAVDELGSLRDGRIVARDGQRVAAFETAAVNPNPRCPLPARHRAVQGGEPQLNPGTPRPS